MIGTAFVALLLTVIIQAVLLQQYAAREQALRAESAMQRVAAQAEYQRAQNAIDRFLEQAVQQPEQ
jgi:hypothetical protein